MTGHPLRPLGVDTAEAGRLAPACLLGATPHVVESNQVNIVASTVLRHLQEIQDAKKPRLARELGRDVREPDRLDRIHLDRTLSHRVSPAYFDVGTRPD